MKVYQLSYIEWWDDFDCYCVVETPAASGDLKSIMDVENKIFRKRPLDIVFIEWKEGDY